jgi:hypothetical protein
VSEQREAVAICDPKDECQKYDGGLMYCYWVLNMRGNMKGIDAFDSSLALVRWLKLRQSAWQLESINEKYIAENSSKSIKHP